MSKYVTGQFTVSRLYGILQKPWKQVDEQPSHTHNSLTKTKDIKISSMNDNLKYWKSVICLQKWLYRAHTQGPYIRFEAIRYICKELGTHIVRSSNNLFIIQTDTHILHYQQIKDNMVSDTAEFFFSFLVLIGENGSLFRALAGFTILFPTLH